MPEFEKVIHLVKRTANEHLERLKKYKNDPQFASGNGPWVHFQESTQYLYGMSEMAHILSLRELITDQQYQTIDTLIVQTQQAMSDIYFDRAKLEEIKPNWR